MDKWDVVLVNELKNISTPELSLKIIRSVQRDMPGVHEDYPQMIAAVFNELSICSSSSGIIRI